MKMIYDYVLVKELKKDSVVVLAAQKRNWPDKGEVVAVGPGDNWGCPEMQKMTLKPGDKVFFVKDKATEVDLKKEDKHYILKEREVYGILEEDEC